MFSNFQERKGQLIVVPPFHTFWRLGKIRFSEHWTLRLPFCLLKHHKILFSVIVYNAIFMFKRTTLFLIVFLLSIHVHNFSYAQNWEWVFDQTIVYPSCIKIQKLIYVKFWWSKWYTPEQWCKLSMIGHQWENGMFVNKAYSTYINILSIKKWIIKIQYNDRYSIPTIVEITVDKYTPPNSYKERRFVVNLMYNNELENGDFFIDNQIPYVIKSAKFIAYDLTRANTYCEKTYWKWYKYITLSHSCKR